MTARDTVNAAAPFTRNEQTAPFPSELLELVERCTYRPGWDVWLADEIRDRDAAGEILARGLTLSILVVGPDTYDPSKTIRVRHLFPVPPATYDRPSWQRWLFERFRDVETHEAMEFFAIDGGRPYVPNHGPGHDVYVVREHGDDLDAATRFTGEITDHELERIEILDDTMLAAVRLPDGRYLTVEIPDSKIEAAVVNPGGSA